MNKRVLFVFAIAALVVTAIYLHSYRAVPGYVMLRNAAPSAAVNVPQNTAPHAPETTPNKTSAPTLVAGQHEPKALATLVDILASKNDNDPRLDRDFNQLSAEEKLAFQQYYRKVAPEKRNERGTIVFLLGRNLTSAADFVFLREVLTEPACLSLDDCAREERSEGGEDHYAADRELTLAYPQVVVIKSIESVLAQPGNSELTQAALATLHTAQNSRIPTVARLAAKVRDR